MKRIIVWFRGDLRVHDHPALSAAAEEAAEIIPLFILDPAFLEQAIGSNRNRFLLESLADLDASLQKRGGRLILKTGIPSEILPRLVTEYGAEAVYYVSDYTPYSIARDKAVAAQVSVPFVGHSGKLVVSAGMKLRTRNNTTYQVFTQFWKAWLDLPRRAVLQPPEHIHVPKRLTSDPMPRLQDITVASDLSPDVPPGGETAGRERYSQFIEQVIERYHQSPTDMADDTSSRLSPYLHFGCVSPLELEAGLPDCKGARAWNRQLAWREFYYYMLLHHPHMGEQEFKPVFRGLTWDDDPAYLEAWQKGLTGYPAVDAGMRQLRREGWMHNRSRMITGSFLTKDLWCDWRLGEAYFRRMLLDGDSVNNVGNWQWIASVGVDPAPVYRRLYNPTLQGKKFDPSGGYIRRYVPELAAVPDKYLYEPWTMPPEVQKVIGLVIGKDYPAPIVDHKDARLYALERYRAAMDSAATQVETSMASHASEGKPSHAQFKQR